MRYILITFLAAAICVSCVKPVSKNPVPTVVFKDFRDIRINDNGETVATLVLSYEDGDGDLFVDNNTQGPNLIFTTYGYDKNSDKFVAYYDTGINDTMRYSTTVRQPANGYYKNKAIRGEIWVPIDRFRPDPSFKIITLRGFMVDLKKNKTQIFASPVYTIDI